MYAKHGNLVDAGVSGAKISTKLLHYTYSSGVATGGSGGSMNRGPRAPGAPEPGTKN